MPDEDYTDGVSDVEARPEAHGEAAAASGQGEPEVGLRSAERRARQPAGSERRLLRSREDRVIAGLCAGIADYVGADVRTVRWLFVVAGALTLGTLIVGYLLLALLIGRQPAAATRPA